MKAFRNKIIETNIQISLGNEKASNTSKYNNLA